MIDPRVLAQLPDSAILQVSVRVGDLRQAITETMGGPAELTPGDAAKRYGRSAKFWRRKAEAGEIEGAYRDRETERWYLPNEGCREHLARKQKAHLPTTTRSVRRGPRKTAARTPPAGPRATD